MQPDPPTATQPQPGTPPPLHRTTPTNTLHTEHGWKQDAEKRPNIRAADGLKAKDLCMVPARVALALQADGWYLRADIIWAKPNPMPESVTDRPTKAHEYLFLLTKSPKYFWDQEAVREPHQPDGRKATLIAANGAGVTTHENYANRAQAERWPNAGRNIRSVWEIATQPYQEAHFATFPEQLVERCLKAGCPEQVCRVCSKPRERIVESLRLRTAAPSGHREVGRWQPGESDLGGRAVNRDIGFTDCGHNDRRPGVILDPFLGSGTTAKVARAHGRHTIGIELNEDYCQLAARRLQQLSLLTEAYS